MNATLDQLEKAKLSATLKDDELEREVLSTMVGYANVYNEVAEQVDEDCFDDMHSRNIFKALKSICIRGDSPEPLTVWAEVQKIDKTITMADFSERALKSGVKSLSQAVKILCEYKARRVLYAQGLQLISYSQDLAKDPMDISNNTAEALSSLTLSTVSNIVNGGDVQNDLVNRLFERRNNPNLDMGILTGFNFIDCGMGLHNGSLIVLAATTGSGKSSLVLAVADAAIKNGAKVAMYSLEMSRNEVQYKLMSMNTGIRLQDLMYSQLSDSQLKIVSNFNLSSYSMYRERLYYDDRFTSNIDVIIENINKMVKKKGVTMVVVDYVQIASSGANSSSNNSTEKELADIVRKLRNIANKLQICIICLSQLSRDRENPIPAKSRLRGSGQIEEAATDIWLLYRPEAEEKKMSYPSPYESESLNGTAMVIVDKCRFGRRDKYLIGFEGETTRFYPI